MICIQNDDLLIVCSNDQLKLFCVEIIFDGLGATGKVIQTVDFPVQCRVVKSLCIANETVILGHDLGITKLDLATQVYRHIMTNNSEHLTEVQCVAFMKEENRIVLTDIGSRQVKIITMDGSKMDLVAGNGEEGKRDGTNASFSQLMGICDE